MVARKLISIILFILLSLTGAGQASAQDAAKKQGKKESRKEKHEKARQQRMSHDLEKFKRREARKKEKQDRKKLKREQRRSKKKGKAKTPAKEAVAVKRQVVYTETELKPRYRVDVLAQMYLDDVKNYKIPDKAVPGISFYEGVNIAADSLKNAGYKIDIYVHDVASANESSENLVNKNLLDSSDLIIGAVPAQDVTILADYAKRRHVNFVSALSPTDGGVKDNQYFTLLQPSLKSHCDWIVGDVAKLFPGMKVALLYRTSTAGDSNAYNYVVNAAAENVSFKKLSCNTLPGKEKLSKLFDANKPNVLVVSILDFAYADSILNEISGEFPETHFEVYGMPSWNSIANLRKEKAFPNLSVNVTVPFYFDTSGAVVKYVAQTFKKEYGGKVTDYVYRGFESMFWYASLLRKYGTIFNDKYSDNSASLFTKFTVQPQWNSSGEILFHENTRIFVSKFEGGTSKTQ